MGAQAHANRHGTIVIRLWWRGRESSESTRVKHSADAMRGIKRTICDPINAEMKARRFDATRYLYYFPEGTRSEDCRVELGIATETGATEMPTLGAYSARWEATNQPPLVRAAQARDRRQHLRAYILPWLGDKPLDAITPRVVTDFREQLLKSVSLKTARNIIDSTLRALIRDARDLDQYPIGDPCAPVKWPKAPRRDIDPFTAGERDTILRYFAERNARYYPFVLTLFSTGMRPSEATALRWSRVDVVSCRVEIRRSRYLGEEQEPKTAGSSRTIRALPAVVEAMCTVTPLHVGPDTYVFTNKDGDPINHTNWAHGERDHWSRALRSCGVRFRKFYATRHTFISLALSAGANLKFIAEYCGTSVGMIERNYGRWMQDQADTQMALLGESIGGESRTLSGKGPRRAGK